jgi:hypothetical protein
LNAKDRRFWHAVHDGADDDSQGAAPRFAAELRGDNMVGDQEDRSAHQQPQPHLVHVEAGFFLWHQIGHDGDQQRARAEAAQPAQHLGRQLEIVDQDSAEQQRRLPHGAQGKRVKHELTPHRLEDWQSFRGLPVLSPTSVGDDLDLARLKIVPGSDDR